MPPPCITCVRSENGFWFSFISLFYIWIKEAKTVSGCKSCLSAALDIYTRVILKRKCQTREVIARKLDDACHNGVREKQADSVGHGTACNIYMLSFEFRSREIQQQPAAAVATGRLRKFSSESSRFGEIDLGERKGASLLSRRRRFFVIR